MKAIREKVQQTEQVIDPGSVRRQAPDAKPQAAASDVEWLSLGAPPQTPKPADGSADPAPPPSPAPDGANGTAAVAARPPATVDAQDGIPSSRQEVADAAITSTGDEGAALLQRVRDNPLDAAAHLDYQLYRFSVGEQVPHLASLAPLPQEDRDALVAVLDGLSNFRSANQSEPNALESKKIQPLMDMAARLRAQAELTLPTVSLCSSVKGFGVYEPLPPSLKAGQDHQVVLYVEVGNFSSHRNEQTQLWETKLKQEAVLYTESGLAVWTDKSDFPPDVSRNRRNDFYVVKKVTLPKALSVGRYFLKVTITDEQAKRVAENSLPLQVVAQ